MALHPVPPPTGEIGVVERASWEGLRHQEIGQAQGWHYPDEATIVLWGCFLEHRYRQSDPTTDPLHLVVWTSWERWLTARSPGARRIMTTWQDVYERPAWEAFLGHQGYQQVALAAFAKEVVGR